jgi:NAD(P)-dependent dehydrogenase (short-subunit alcohol dehydrogenase family)
MVDERVVVVTGGAKGIGLACARRFSRDGALVVIADLDEALGLEAARELGADDNEALFVRCDVSDRLDVRNMVAETLTAFGRVDVLVNNAGVVAGGDLFTLTEEDFDWCLATNLKGAFLCGQAVARQMKAQIEQAGARVDDVRRRYAIVNMSSVNAVTAIPEHLAYNVSKGGMNQLTRAMALALAPLGVRVNAVAPGSVNTDVLKLVVDDPARMKQLLSRTPLGRVADTDEIASVAAFLASADASYITGEILYADGGRLALNLVM